jgi:hypothetical protein
MARGAQRGAGAEHVEGQVHISGVETRDTKDLLWKRDEMREQVYKVESHFITLRQHRGR